MKGCVRIACGICARFEVINSWDFGIKGYVLGIVYDMFIVNVEQPLPWQLTALAEFADIGDVLNQ